VAAFFLAGAGEDAALVVVFLAGAGEALVVVPVFLAVVLVAVVDFLAVVLAPDDVVVIVSFLEAQETKKLTPTRRVMKEKRVFFIG
jgi:hypothetical protein